MVHAQIREWRYAQNTHVCDIVLAVRRKTRFLPLQLGGVHWPTEQTCVQYGNISRRCAALTSVECLPFVAAVHGPLHIRPLACRVEVSVVGVPTVPPSLPHAPSIEAAIVVKPVPPSGAGAARFEVSVVRESVTPSLAAAASNKVLVGVMGPPVAAPLPSTRNSAVVGVVGEPVAPPLLAGAAMVSFRAAAIAVAHVSVLLHRLRVARVQLLNRGRHDALLRVAQRLLQEGRHVLDAFHVQGADGVQHLWGPVKWHNESNNY